MSIIANEPQNEIAQRRLDTGHAFRLAQYMLKGLLHAASIEASGNGQMTDSIEKVLHRMGMQSYTGMQPLVVNIRNAGARGVHLNAKAFPEIGPPMGFTVFLRQQDLFYVVDGQHRRMAVDYVLAFLHDVRTAGIYPKLKTSLYPYDVREVSTEELAVWELVYGVARSVCTVAVEAHLGLNIEQERQLFHDLNNLTKPVEKSLALQFDSANPVNQFIKTALLIPEKVRLAKGDKIDWNDNDTGAMTRKDLVAVNARLFLNKSNINGATALDVEEKQQVAERYWDAVIQCEGFGDLDARSTTVLAQPVMLKALAKLAYDFAFGRPRQRNEAHLNKLLDGLTDLNFSHDNPIWRYYELTKEEMETFNLIGLDEYLPPASTGNRDIGGFDKEAGVMRFGAKHNDIFPILGDMVRFQLGLPSRHQQAVTVENDTVSAAA